MEIDLANFPKDARAFMALEKQLLGTLKTQVMKMAQFKACLSKLKRMQFG